MDIHESPVTCVQYYSDCPSDLIGALTLVGCKQRKKGYSDRVGLNWTAKYTEYLALAGNGRSRQGVCHGTSRTRHHGP